MRLTVDDCIFLEQVGVLTNPVERRLAVENEPESQAIEETVTRYAVLWRNNKPVAFVKFTRRGIDAWHRCTEDAFCYMTLMSEPIDEVVVYDEWRWLEIRREVLEDM